MSVKLRNKRGQNTAEYLILLVLVAVGSIGIFSFFGDTLHDQVQNVAAAITGDSSLTATTNTDTDVQKVRGKGIGMGISKDQIKRFGENTK